MKIIESWLREWVNPKQDAATLAELLSLSGLEVDALHANENDHLFDINITPNRGDCLSIKGVAREVAALTETKLTPLQIPAVNAQHNDLLKVTLQSADCPVYQGRIIRGVDNNRPTPEFITKRLTELGVRSISLIVDIANYVMFELGQPLHAFDLSKIDTQIIVRDAKKGEHLTLLDETTAQLDERTLVIADSHKPLALAGVMGGLESGVTLATTDIFLESAFFNPKRIAGKTRLYGINSDGAYRFERGVDPSLHPEALERATALILEYAQGIAGPVTLAGQNPARPSAILLRAQRINQLLGLDFPSEIVAPILQRLNMQVTKHTTQETAWQVIPPSFRFDITREEDLIEELARVYGYQHIPASAPKDIISAIAVPEERITPERLRSRAVDRGYYELICYSFVEHAIQQLFTQQEPLTLLNPMSSQMDVMRMSLLPGLLQALCYNQNRQQTQMRLFELGLCFLPQSHGLVQQQFIAGVLSSQQTDKHWQLSKRDANFYDIKGDVEALLALTGRASEFSWQQGQHQALHPGQTAQLMHQGFVVGWVGQLHPQIAKQLDVKGKVFVFELQLDVLLNGKTPAFAGISKFPAIRRDLSMLVDSRVPAQDLCKVVSDTLPGLLQDVKIFDVYQGEGIAKNMKSVAMAMLLQAPKTLVDAEINALIEKVIQALEQTYQVIIRD